METLILTICGFYIQSSRLQQLKELGAGFCLDYPDYTFALNNMKGEIVLTKGSCDAIMKRGDNEFNFKIHYVSGLSLHGQTESYPEIQFGQKEHTEFRLITKPEITRKQIEDFIGLYEKP